MGKLLDLQGKRYGRLLVIRRERVAGAHNAMWRCQCDCGNITIAAAANIGRDTMSCGCLQKEIVADLLRRKRYSRTHGMSQTPEFRSWAGMKERCYNPKNPKYHRYGARGIRICRRWLNSFQNFYDDMGKKPSRRHTIDRLDNDGNYEPQNCQWAMPKAQSTNRSTTHFVKIGHTTLCVRDWCRALGIARWVPYEMTRTRDGRRPEFSTVEDALKHLYRTKKP